MDIKELVKTFQKVKEEELQRLAQEAKAASEDGGLLKV